MDVDVLLSGRAGPEGVRASLHSSALRRSLRATLVGMLAEPDRLGPCRLRRSKFKPGLKLTAYFDTGLLPHGARRALAVRWWRGQKPSPEDAAAEADAASRGLTEPFRHLSAHVPAMWMRVDVAPLDPGFPGLVRLSDPAYVGPLLGFRGRPDVLTVRYRPGQRHLLRYQTRNGAGDHAVFAKVYRDDDGARDALVANAVADLLDEGGPGCAGARPAAHLEEERAVLFPLVAGAPLSSLLRRADPGTAEALRVAGSSLRRLHEAAPELTTTFEARTVEDEIAEVERATTTIQQLVPRTGTVVRGVLARTRDVFADLPAEAPGLGHGDYKADHLLCGPAAMTLIDFDRCALADPALDLAKFLADLRWWLAGRTRHVLAAAQAQFLGGYGPTSQARVARAMALEPLFVVKLAARRVQVHQPRWEDRTRALVGRAERLVQEQTRR